jgi:hypothetical protein
VELLGLLCTQAVVRVDALTGERLFEPVEELSGRIDLVIVLARWQHTDFVPVVGEPGRRLWDVDKPVLNHRGLRVQPHDLLAVRLVARDAVAVLGDQLLDPLGAGGLVLDLPRHWRRTPLLLANRALERRIFQPPMQHAQ